MASGNVCVSPGILETNVMVAPNSPSPRANDSSAPVRTPVDRLDRQPHRTHHQGQPHDGTRQRRAGPAERHDDARLLQQCAEWTARSQKQKQEIPDDHRRQDQRQVHHCIEQALARKIAARQQPGHGECRRQADHDAPEGHLEAEEDDLQLGNGNGHYRPSRPKP
jgi:hypothetical protein